MKPRKLTPEEIHKLAMKPLPSVRVIISLSKGAGTKIRYDSNRDWDKNGKRD